ncbi:MAG: UDP-glucose 4-epimerase GalE [Oscillospiraceae bacterium]|nr:UDP-glucose 4-epimerase GalE [Oscillospiraceae bacterium]
MQILVTGGAGYIGSHTCVELLQAGHEVVILDNLYNAKESTLARIEKLGGKAVTFVKGDTRDRACLVRLFQECQIDAAIHFAALKAVNESIQIPLPYYENNVAGTVNLSEVMSEYGCKTLVFSSSATVYGDRNPVPFREDMPVGKATNPYGTTKIMNEQILADLCVSDPEWRVTLLRYFNPVGAHPSGELGEDPNRVPLNIAPIIQDVAMGKRDKLLVTGHDYPTPDGTCIRDYIHIADLAAGHVKALEHMVASPPGCEVFNLGTGKGTSVLELVEAFECVNGVKIPMEYAPRRAGDIAECYADVSKAERVLGWKTQYGIDDMCRDVWKWLHNLNREQREREV